MTGSLKLSLKEVVRIIELLQHESASILSRFLRNVTVIPSAMNMYKQLYTIMKQSVKRQECVNEKKCTKIRRYLKCENKANKINTILRDVKVCVNEYA